MGACNALPSEGPKKSTQTTEATPLGAEAPHGKLNGVDGDCKTDANVDAARQEEAIVVRSKMPTFASQETCTRGWNVDIGVLNVGSEGIHLKPQMKLGVHVANVTVEAGIGDVRDGLQVGAKAEAGMALVGSGHTISELHESIRCDTLGVREALDTAKELLAEASEQICESLGINERELENALEGTDGDASRGAPMTLKVEAAIGVGADAHVCLGWKDTNGYRMMGVGGKAAAAIAAGAKVFAGKHKSGGSAKVVLGISNFTLEYTFPIGSPLGADQCQKCHGIGKRDGFIMSSSCSKCNGSGKCKSFEELGAESSARQGGS